MFPRWIATCPEDTKAVLLAELVGLGVDDPNPIYRGVTFNADLATGYRAHLSLRTASRIQRVVGELPAGDARAFAQAAAEIPWAEWLNPKHAFSIAPILTDSGAQALAPSIVSALSAAITAAFPVPPALHPDAPVTLVAHVRGGVCTLGLDTAGRALHKRGWRLPGHPAVIKETLAAATLLLAGYDGTEPVYDPMCGSGTIIVEAAYIALNKAPLIHRGKDDFGFELHAGFDRALWRLVSDQARAARRTSPPAPLFASDIRPEFVELARKGALRARVERDITFSNLDFIQSTPPAERGLLVANLPYGERIGRGEIEALYKEVGRVVRDRYTGWRTALLVPAEAPRGALRLPVRREFSLMNGSIPVRLLLVG